MDPAPTPDEEKPAEEPALDEGGTVPPLPEEPSSPPIPEIPPQTEQPATPQTPLEEPPPSPEATEGQASPEPVVPPATTPTVETPPTPQPTQSSLKSFLQKALESIQFRKKAKLEKIMKLANEKRSITNDQAQKLLHVSDATATRYLSTLVRQGRLKRLGISGSTRYEPTLGSNGGN